MKTISKPTILSILLILTINSLADTLTVKQDGTGDYTIIQNAVNAAIDGDTVLVWPGTYFENVTCEGKTITLGSLTLTTGDLGYINQTIINGNQTGSCIEIDDCQSVNIINGFTLENGSGTWHGAIGGGGLSAERADAEIYNCIIKNNMVTGSGGGIYCEDSELFLSNLTITNNHSYKTGGGLYIYNGEVEFDSINKCNIYLNYSSQGTDIYKTAEPSLHVITDTFTVSTPDYYYLYSNFGWGFPGDDITYEIGTGKIQAVTQDLYVAPDGDNSNTGLTPQEPLRNISFALLKMASDSILPDTIHVEDGIYTPSSGEKFPLSIKRDICIKGQSRDFTILDAEDEIYLLHGIYHANNYHISNITLQHGNGNKNSPYGFGTFNIRKNITSCFENILVKDNVGYHYSGGPITNSNNFELKHVEFRNNIGGQACNIGHADYEIYYDTIRLTNCKFIDNVPDYSIPPDEGGFGGGMTIVGDANDPDLFTGILSNCLFIRNHARDHPFGGMSQISISVSRKSNVYATNCTFSENTSDNNLGGNIGVTSESSLNIYNSILYDNSPAELYMYTYEGNSNLNIYNSLVQGGEEEIRLYSSGNTVYYDETNIDTDPLFYGGPEFPYNLSDLSPCINAGTLDLPDFIELPEFDLAGNPRVYGETIDMGAYEWNPTVGVDEHRPITKEQEKLLKAAPNPFSRSTTITATFKTKSSIKIEVYNNHGQRVRALMDGPALPGTSRILWRGDDDNGQALPAGVYHLVMFADDKEIDGVKVVKR